MRTFPFHFESTKLRIIKVYLCAYDVFFRTTRNMEHEAWSMDFYGFASNIVFVVVGYLYRIVPSLIDFCSGLKSTSISSKRKLFVKKGNCDFLFSIHYHSIPCALYQYQYIIEFNSCNIKPCWFLVFSSQLGSTMRTNMRNSMRE